MMPFVCNRLWFSLRKMKPFCQTVALLITSRKCAILCAPLSSRMKIFCFRAMTGWPHTGPGPLCFFPIKVSCIIVLFVIYKTISKYEYKQSSLFWISFLIRRTTAGNYIFDVVNWKISCQTWWPIIRYPLSRTYISSTLSVPDLKLNINKSAGQFWAFMFST